MLYPLFWMFSAAFKPNHEIFSSLSLWPKECSLDGFINGWNTGTEYLLRTILSKHLVLRGAESDFDGDFVGHCGLWICSL